MTRFAYSGAFGTIVVTVPWGDGSGRPPPPLIHFGDWAFRYAGPLEDDEPEVDDLPRPGHGGVQP